MEKLETVWMKADPPVAPVKPKKPAGPTMLGRLTLMAWEKLAPVACCLVVTESWQAQAL
jgi:hypothetical protein